MVRGMIAVIAAAALAGLTTAALAGSYDGAFENRFAGPGDRAALDAFVIAAVDAGQYDQAIASLEQVLFENPNDLDARIALARLYYHLGAYDLASANLDQAAVLGAGPEIARLSAAVERGRNGIETELSVTGGVAWRRSSLTTTSTADTISYFTPYVVIDGRIVRTLADAARDEVRLGGTLRYDKAVSDTNFDGTLDRYDNLAGHVEAVFSKGLPDIADTLRVDFTGYGQAESYGGGRDLRELGVKTEISIEPTVESRLAAWAGYGWLGASRNLYGQHRARYGVNGELRVAPRVALGAHVSGYTEWGTAPVAFLGGGTGYTAHGYEVGAAVSHLIHVFSDGRRWQQQLGVTWSAERILDYSTVSGAFPILADMVDRRAWQIAWDQTVQITTRTDLTFGVSYGKDNITDTAVFTTDRDGEHWGVRAGVTVRFN